MTNHKGNNDIYAPVCGTCLDITQCSDNTFSNCLIGDGFMIDPQSDYVCAPCDGIVSMIFPTKHAFGIKTVKGDELLIHIGIETVNLKGDGFTFLSQLNKKIKKGEKIMKCNFAQMRGKGYEVPVIVLVTGKQELEKRNIGCEVTTDDMIISV